jgi:release factor glutamine methyltransferase
MKTVRETVMSISRQFSDAGIVDPRLEAEVLVAHVLGTDRTHLLATFSDLLSSEAAKPLPALIERRLQREPLAYLVGWREFYGLRLAVREGVLIPRQETETLVDEALRLVRGQYGPAPVIADVGCGCGAIALALAAHLPKAAIYALDNSSTAIEVTRLNAAALGLSERVHVLQGDLLQPLPVDVDVIAANVPYVRTDEFAALQPEVLHEPRQALDGGADGLHFIRRLFEEAAEKLRLGGAVLVECAPRQMQPLLRYISRLYPGRQVWAVRDLSGRRRVAVLQNTAEVSSDEALERSA